MAEVQIPDFFVRRNADLWGYRPDHLQLQSQANNDRKRLGIRPSSTDSEIISVLNIDNQRDFDNPNGTLMVGGRSGRGAIDNAVTLCEWVYRNINRITDFTCTMDSHFPIQIFFPAFWVDRNGNHPAPFTNISHEDVVTGKWLPSIGVATMLNANYTWLKQYCEHYTKKLMESAKKELTIWPYHCLLGGEGHSLLGVVDEARLYHSFIRYSAGRLEVKGAHALTESYSIFGPEVLTDQNGNAIVQKNVALFETLANSHKVVVAGQASSHCVLETLTDLLRMIKTKDADLAKKVYILRDCMSPVVIPGVVDFTDATDAAMQELQDAGMNLVDSTVPIDDWASVAA